MNETSVEPKQKSAPLLENYERRAGAFDEFLAENGQPRAQYKKLFSELETFSVAEIRRRRDGCSEKLLAYLHHMFSSQKCPRGDQCKPRDLD